MLKRLAFAVAEVNPLLVQRPDGFGLCCCALVLLDAAWFVR